MNKYTTNEPQVSISLFAEIPAMEALVDLFRKGDQVTQLDQLLDLFNKYADDADILGLFHLILDLQGVIRFANSYFYKMTSFKEEEVVGQKLAAILDHFSQNSNPDEGIKLLVSGRTEKYVFLAKMKDNSHMRSKWILTPLRSGSEILGIRCTGIIIDDIIDMLAECCDEPLLYENILKQLPAAIVLTDLDENILYVNPLACKILGRSNDELIGKNFANYVVPEDRKIISKQTHKRMDGVRSSYIVRISMDSGTVRHIQITAAPYKTPTGDIIYTLGYLVDVTSMVENKRLIDEEREKLRIISEASSDAIIILDEEYRILFWNRAGTEIFGYTQEEVLGTKITDLVRNEYTRQVIDGIFQKGLSDGVVLEHQSAFFPKKDGSEVGVDISLGFLNQDEKQYIICVIRNVTEKLRSERLLHQQTRELQLYASLLRHDLRNDISLILSNIDLARAIIDADTMPELEEIFESTESVCERILRILITFGKPHEIDSLDLRDLITQVIKQERETYPNLKISVTDLAGQQDLKVVGVSLLPMVLENLVRNTAKYAGPDAEISISISKLDGMAEIIVKDNGPGISEEIRDRLFQRGASTQGTGLGLYLSQEILKMLGGSIELLESGPDIGTAFKISIPLL